MSAHATNEPAAFPSILPGATLGVMGGGQLGQMFVHAAQSMGYRTAVLDPDAASPAGLVSHRHVAAGYENAEGLAALAHEADAITTEFENVPAAALTALAQLKRVAPAAAAVAIAQDRATEKNHFRQLGVPCAPFAVIDSEAALQAVDEELLPGILKTARLGYDGKGQITVADRAALREAWQTLGQVVCVLEQRLELDYEVSVVLARGFDGTIVHLPVQRNIHRNGILATTLVLPGHIAEPVAQQVLQAARRIAEGTGYVGVLCVEFFVLGDGSVVANEMAPRPHNSGHYSIDACDVSQFELQVRTLAGLPLTAPRQHSPAVMLNVLGDLWFPSGSQAPRTPDWAAILGLPGVHLHLYGKAEARRGRKMGHVTITADTTEVALETAARAARQLGLPLDF
ncbi:5-(carboxyamino)imidazole ribonucleotide synthase [Corticibacter populi]|uniref:N5-carboxyaminoimidazole ribonucleotide synthase n=1 Tax=Corticibacter populi TaxID=1550736 RepID=A0A3M6QP06_9BURK|nr:5-(carboxyamino)imidazole ribonucleotide synthase [Corticibacter populi]RMX04803.1 5-(carboxyamino)imidazole ribonucleotide synthase [Corticibacter populi]RZS33784.1 5-(carboxyamino)imidazole ribonucleotide synthase [Corticibacter populi]